MFHIRRGFITQHAHRNNDILAGTYNFVLCGLHLQRLGTPVKRTYVTRSTRPVKQHLPSLIHEANLNSKVSLHLAAGTTEGKPAFASLWQTNRAGAEWDAHTATSEQQRAASTKLCKTRLKHRVRKGRQRARWTELTSTSPKLLFYRAHACLFDLCRRRWRRGWMLTHEGRGAVCRSMWGVTLVSRWEGFPAMFLKISEVSLSKYECLKKKERVPVNRSAADWLNVVV